MNEPQAIRVLYFTDVLCVWAYVSQVRVEELKRHFGSQIALSYHFIPIFGCTRTRIGDGWKDRGGFAGYADHVLSVCRDFPHAPAGDGVWNRNIPSSSAMGHHFLKSVQLLEEKAVIPGAPDVRFEGRSLFEEASWRIRTAFFRDSADVSRMDRLFEIGRELGLPLAAIMEQMNSGEALAAMCRDIELRDKFRVEGSPTYVLNEGRQKLYGNLGYKIIEANVQELLHRPEGKATWC